MIIFVYVVLFEWISSFSFWQAMDLENWNPQKNFESSGFRNSKTLNSHYIVIPIFNKPFTGRIVNYPVGEEVFWKKSSGQRLWH